MNTSPESTPAVTLPTENPTNVTAPSAEAIKVLETAFPLRTLRIGPATK